MTGARVGGVDGCRGGWVLALAPVEPGPGTEVSVHAHFAAVWAAATAAEVAALGVDMPIGLTADGRRVADGLARARLGPRRSTLFPTPPEAVLHAADHRDALARCRAATGGTGLSVQAWNLVPKMREVAAVLSPADQPRVAEVHPETSFTAMAGAPLAPKRTPEGRAERRSVLATGFGDVDAVLAVRPRGVGVDDLLDALAAAWTARRMAVGTAEWLGNDTDPRGFTCTIAV